MKKITFKLNDDDDDDDDNDGDDVSLQGHCEL